MDKKRLGDLFDGVSNGGPKVLEMGTPPTLSESYLLSIFKWLDKIRHILLEMSKNDFIILDDGDKIQKQLDFCMQRIKNDIHSDMFKDFPHVQKKDVELFEEQAIGVMKLINDLKIRLTVAALLNSHKNFVDCVAELKHFAAKYGLRSKQFEYANRLLLNKEFRKEHPARDK